MFCKKCFPFSTWRYKEPLDHRCTRKKKAFSSQSRVSSDILYIQSVLLISLTYHQMVWRNIFSFNTLSQEGIWWKRYHKRHSPLWIWFSPNPLLKPLAKHVYFSKWLSSVCSSGDEHEDHDDSDEEEAEGVTPTVRTRNGGKFWTLGDQWSVSFINYPPAR